MDEAQVKTLIAKYFEDNSEKLFDPIVTSLSSSLTDYLDKRVSPIEAALTEPKPQPQAETKAEAEDTPAAKRLQMLEQKLADMEKAKNDAERKAEDSAIEQAISNSLAESNTLHSGFLTKSLYKDIRDSITRQEDGSFLTKDGKTIAESVSQFLSTDTGKHFLPSQAVSGTGTPKADPVKTDAITAQDLISAFL